MGRLAILAPPEKAQKQVASQAYIPATACKGNTQKAVGVHLALSGGIRAPSPLLVALTALVARLRLRQGQRASLAVTIKLAA